MQPPDYSTDVSSIDLSSSRKPIVLIGASVRAAAQSAERAGFDVFGVDSFGDVDTRHACRWFCTLEELESLPPETFASLFSIGSLGGSGLGSSRMGDTPMGQRGAGGNGAPWMIAGGDAGDASENANGDGQITKFERLRRRLDRFAKRVGADESVYQQLCDPDVLARIAIRTRTTFPPYRRGDEGAPHRAANTIGHPTQRDVPGQWLSKQLVSSGGLGVTWAGTPSQQGDPANQNELPIAAHQMHQLWQPGRSYGVTFLSDGENVVMLGVCRSSFTAIGAKRFTYAGSYGPVRLPVAVQRQLQAIGRQAVDQVGVKGLFNADVLIDDDGGVCLLEINPRWTASMECIERSLLEATAGDKADVSLIGSVMRIDDGKPLHLNQRRVDSMMADAPRFLKRVIFAQQPGVVDGDILDDIESTYEDKTDASGFANVWICDRPSDEEPIRAGDPLVSVVCQQNVRQRLSWRKTKRLFASLQKAVR